MIKIKEINLSSDNKKQYINKERKFKMKLFIIGNGFDLHFHLKTSVGDFKNYLLKHKITNMINTNALEFFDEYGVDWNEYEDSLANLNINDLYDEFFEAPDYYSDYESDRDGGISKMEDLVNELISLKKGSLREMIENAEEQISLLKKRSYKPVFDQSIVINFNYTSTLEGLFNPKNSLIYHIHGFLKEGDNLLFGYKNKSLLITNEMKYKDTLREIDEIQNNSRLSKKNKENMVEEINYLAESDYDDYYLDKQKEIVNSFYLNNKKDFQYKRLKEILNEIRESGIDEIVVLGHSMAEVDCEYMEMIEQILVPDRWIISQYEGSPNFKSLKEYSFFNKIQFCEITDYLS